MCMSCTEVMAQEALNFYRKTRARGAASLFANAITQTGITKVIKFAVFKQWVNGMRLRQQRGKKQEITAARAFRATLVKKPFRAWMNFTKDSVLERNHKAIEELTARVGILEAQVAKAVAERSAFEQQSKWTDKILKERDVLIEKQQTQIVEQAGALEEAQRRIVGLSALSGPLLAYGKLVKTTAASLTGDIRRRFLRAARSSTPAHDYTASFVDAEEVGRLLKKETMRRKEGRAVKLDDTSPMVELLLIWANAKAKEASLVATDITGASLQDFLPKFRIADSVEDLCSGATLLRVVVALIFDQSSQHGTNLRLASEKTDMEMETEGADAPALVLTESIVQDVKAAAKSQKEVVDKALSLAHKHLNVPLFSVADVVGGEVPPTLALLSHLMLASSTAAVHPQSLQHVGDLIRMFEVQEAAVETAEAAVSCDAISSLHDRLLELKGLKEVEIGDTDAFGDTGPADVPTTTTMGVEGQVEADATVDKAKPRDQKQLVDPAAKYNRLLAATDSLVDASLLVQQVSGIREALEELALLGASLEEIEGSRDKGMRLATSVKRGVSAFQYEVMLRELRWVT